jgi:streptogramin lyase
MMKKTVISICAMALLTSLALGQAPAPAPAAPLNEKYVINKEWAQSPADMPTGAMSSVAADGKGNVVVLARVAPFVRVFTREGKFVKAWGEAGLFTLAHSVMFDRDGNLWATDTTGHVVHKYDANGKELMTLGKKGMAGDNTSQDMFNQPDAVAIAPNGDIYVSDGYVNARVVHFDKTGKFIRIIGGTKGAAPGQLQLPHGVVVDSKGRILVGDSDNKRITVFDKDGKFVETWPFQSRGGTATINIVKDGKLIDAITGLGRPHGITIDTDGAIYTADATNRIVLKVSPKK